MAKVYVLNNSGHDYTDAERFGDIVFCTEGNLPKNDISALFRTLSDALAFAREEDYIVVSSLSSVCAIAAGIMADRYGKVNFLVFESGRYSERTVTFESYYNKE